VAQQITPVELVVMGSGRLVVKLSEDPSPKWRKLFGDFMRESAGYGAVSKKTAFQGWDNSVPGPVINTGVDDFTANYRDIVRDAAEHANRESARHEAESAGKEKDEVEAKDRDEQELNRERDKAKKIKFD